MNLLIFAPDHWSSASLFTVDFSIPNYFSKSPTLTSEVREGLNQLWTLPDYFLLLAFARSFHCLLRLQVLQIWERVFYHRALIVLYSFPRFCACTATTCFSHDFSCSQQFNLECNRGSRCSLKHIPTKLFLWIT